MGERLSYECIWRASLVNPYHLLKYPWSVPLKNNKKFPVLHVILQPFLLFRVKLNKEWFISAVSIPSPTHSSVQFDLASTLYLTKIFY